jgi:hypothetical protein
MYRSLLKSQRWLLRSAAYIAVIAVALALILFSMPYLIDGHAMRDRFVRTLSTWGGGPVMIRGHLRIASFATLSVEAEDVSFPAVSTLSPVASIHAKSVTAVARLSSLLRGELRFKKVILDNPRIVLRREGIAKAGSGWGNFDVAAVALAACTQNSLADLELVQPVVLSASGPRSAYRKVAMESIRLEKAQRPMISLGRASSGNVSIRCNASAAGFQGRFQGDFDSASNTAAGSLTLTARDQSPSALPRVAILVPREGSGNLSVSGDFVWSNERMALDGATIAFGGRSAKGSLALKRGLPRPLLDGTLSYDTLDLTRENEAMDDHELPLTAGLDFFRPEQGWPMDLDLRLSASHVRAGPVEGGPLALSLTTLNGRTTADIVELGLFGGSLTGSMDFDPAHARPLAVRLSGSRLDAAALARLLRLPVEVTGEVGLKANATFPLSAPTGAAGLDAVGVFVVDFPSGGSIEGGAARDSDAGSQKTAYWGLGRGPLGFSTARIEGQLDARGIRLAVHGWSSTRRISGNLQVANPGNSVSGTLTVTAALQTGDSDTQTNDTQRNTNDRPDSEGQELIVSGTVAALKVSASGKTSVSN